MTGSPASRVTGQVRSDKVVAGAPERVWREITNVDIADYDSPVYLRALGIPHPLRAELVSEGVGGERIAYFATGKRFIQRITAWDPPQEYAFTFNPEHGFTVLYFFDLSDGVVQIPSGEYLLTAEGSGTRIKLGTEYSIDRRTALVLRPFVRTGLRTFQAYLLRSIAENVERPESAAQ